MCGRTACTLEPDDICRACGFMKPSGRWVEPQWRDTPGGQKYYPSYNLAPSQRSPILFSKSHIRSEGVKDFEKSENAEEVDEECDWVVQPMHWGLIPHWHHGDPKDFSYKMNNARSDGLLQKASFKKPLEMGRRCVVLADGYFEWNTSKDGKKQPYFIYFPSVKVEKECLNPKGENALKNTAEDDVKVKQEDNGGGGVCEKSETESKLAEMSEKNFEIKKLDCDETRLFGVAPSGKPLLTMAGLFDIWSGKGGEVFYSYSVITVDAHPDLNFIHDRMPAILNGEEEVRQWLNYKSFPLSKALELIRPVNCLKYHPVSAAVNDARNKSPDCVVEIDPKALPVKKSSASSNFMKSWLKTGTGQESSGQVKRGPETENDPAEKKVKFFNN